MTQYDLLQTMRRPQVDDLAVNEYGDRAYGTPESTLWNDAYERARARIDNPRYLAPGITYNGHSGNIDSPELVNEQVFKPLDEAFRPETTRDMALQAQIAHQQALERQAAERMGLMTTEFGSRQADRTARRDAAINRPPPMSPQDYYESRAAAKKAADLSVLMRDPAHTATPEEITYRESLVKRAKQLQKPTMTATNQVSFAPIAAPTSPINGRIRVRGPNGQTGTVSAGVVLPSGWTSE